MKMKYILLTAFLAGFCVTDQALAVSNALPLSSTKNQQQNGIRIVQGKPAAENQFPWHVDIKACGYRNCIRCGGSLISPKWVLTAAQCTYRRDNISVFYGSTKQNKLSEVEVLRIHYHDNFSPDNFKNDIGLIFLNNTELFENFTYVRLPNFTDVENSMSNVKATLSSFGTGKDLHYINSTTITNEECLKTFEKNIYESTLCAKTLSGTGICDGDTGSALVYNENDGKPTQIGIASFISKNGCNNSQPAGYTRVTHYLDWIQRTTDIVIRTYIDEPFQISIVADNGRSCGGSLISPQWILTAASCVFGTAVVRVRERRLFENAQMWPAYHNVSSFIVHHEYNEHDNNIALVKLEKELDPKLSTIKVMRLPSNAGKNDALDKEDVIISDVELRKEIIQVYQTRQKTVTNDFCAGIHTDMQVKKFTICAVPEPGTEICSKDEGGALTRVESDKKRTLIGIFAFKYDHCNKGFPIGYTRVAHYLNWISEKTEIPIRNNAFSLHAVNIIVFACVLLQKTFI